MKYRILIIIISLISQVSFAQTDFQSEFAKLCKINDTISQKKILTKWEKQNPKDAELYTSYFNYYFLKSKKEVIALTTEKPKGEGLILKDSLNQTAGYLGSQIYYDESNFNKSIEYINKGIGYFPNRLDMRFGKIYVYGVTENWKDFTTEIIKTVEYSNTNKNQWTWTNNEPVENPKDFFLGNIQSYVYQLYNTGNDSLLKNMREISETILKYYPNNIESLSNISVTYLLNKEYDKALKPLLRAEKLDPKDYIVLGNIAQAYKLKGDKKKSIEYYKKTAKYGDEKTKKYANEQITELKK